MTTLIAEIWVPEEPGAQGGATDTFRIPIPADDLLQMCELRARESLTSLGRAAELLPQGGTATVAELLGQDVRAVAWQLVQSLDAINAISRWAAPQESLADTEADLSELREAPDD